MGIIHDWTPIVYTCTPNVYDGTLLIGQPELAITVMTSNEFFTGRTSSKPSIPCPQIPQRRWGLLESSGRPVPNHVKDRIATVIVQGYGSMLRAVGFPLAFTDARAHTGDARI